MAGRSGAQLHDRRPHRVHVSGLYPPRCTGVETGAQLVAEGTVGQHDGRLAMLNPLHEVLKRTPMDPVRG